MDGWCLSLWFSFFVMSTFTITFKKPESLREYLSSERRTDVVQGYLLADGEFVGCSHKLVRLHKRRCLTRRGFNTPLFLHFSISLNPYTRNGEVEYQWLMSAYTVEGNRHLYVTGPNSLIQLKKNQGTVSSFEIIPLNNDPTRFTLRPAINGQLIYRQARTAWDWLVSGGGAVTFRMDVLNENNKASSYIFNPQQFLQKFNHQVALY
jgi:hypothetical protein